jgi:hypothetical protein
MFGADRRVCGMLPGTVHVATFASEEEFAAVAANVDAGWSWVGLSEPRDIDDYISIFPFEPGWSTPCTGCYAHNPNPTAGLPQGTAMGSGGAYCVQASSDLSQRAWQKIPCSSVDPPINVICETEPVGSHVRSCDAGTCVDLVWNYGEKTYVYGGVPVSADAAEQACRALGGRLVVLGSRDEREQLWKELGLGNNVLLRPSTGVWIGLSKSSGAVAGDGGTGDAGNGLPDAASSAGTWTWDDDAAVDIYPSPWGFNRPKTGDPDLSTRAYLYNEQPMASDDTLARNDGPMPTALPYVCELDVVDGGVPSVSNGDP